LLARQGAARVRMDAPRITLETDVLVVGAGPIGTMLVRRDCMGPTREGVNNELTPTTPPFPRAGLATGGEVLCSRRARGQRPRRGMAEQLWRMASRMEWHARDQRKHRAFALPPPRRPRLT
jgi:hypothetical protein